MTQPQDGTNDAQRLQPAGTETMTTRETARALVQRALVASFPENASEHAQTLEEYGDSLFAIAEQFDIPDETLVFWIGDKPKWKDWSLQSFSRYAASYAKLRAQVAQTPAEAAQEEPAAREPQPTRLCSTCFSTVIQPIGNGRWWCTKCGEVQP